MKIVFLNLRRYLLKFSLDGNVTGRVYDKARDLIRPVPKAVGYPEYRCGIDHILSKTGFLFSK